MSSPSMPALHLIIPTHTTRHLRLTLLGAAHQTRRADSVTVTCDNTEPAIETLLRDCSREFSVPITLVRRPHQGRERLAQVRNNAIRSLVARGFGKGGGGDADRLLFLDGDCFAAPDVFAAHDRLGAAHRAELVIAYRINLTEPQTTSFDEAAARDRRPPVEISPEQRAGLLKRHRRYVRQQWLRRLGLTKGHKPKTLGGHHSVTLGAYLRVNGHDEEYHTWGTEDDDFCRRVYQSGGTSVVAVKDLMVLHLYHPSRQAGPWEERDNAERFAKGGPTRCTHGVEDALSQGPVEVIEIAP